MHLRNLFLRHNAQTSTAPLALEIVKAEGCTLYGADGKEYIDLIGGISVANTGHRHPGVVQAIKRQLDEYLHIMVYGELVQAPQVLFAEKLVQHLPVELNSVYFTNSGAEAVEGAMKLAKKFTGRTEIIGFENAYHGSTQGALSLMGTEYWRNAFRPLLPGVRHLRFNSEEDLSLISERTAAVFLETVQGEAGIVRPSPAWLDKLRARCSAHGVLLVFDEIQAGFGRTGKLWGFEHFGVVPDVLLLGKALGGGMPLGAFITSRQIMQSLAENPVLGHITTFGGHPVCCAAGLAAMEVLLEERLIENVHGKEELFLSRLAHPSIRSVSSMGLWMAVRLESEMKCRQAIDSCLQQGVFTDWFLFAPDCIRISPPLTITDEEIIKACDIILQSIS